MGELLSHNMFVDYAVITKATEDGVRDILCGLHPDAMSDRPGRTAFDIQNAVLEPMARCFLPAG